MTTNSWHQISNVDEVDSPSLLIYPDRVEENVRRMIRMAGGADRLCPHVKTHKLAELIHLQLRMGITKFKCATIAEAEMVADCGASDVMLAHQPVGPKARRLIALMNKFPRIKFSTIADDESAVRNLAEAAHAAKVTIPVLLDVDCGMGRSGIVPGERALALYRLISTLPGISAGGLHVYDGHLHDADPVIRSEKCDAGFARVEAFRQELLRESLSVPRMVAGGTPTFPMHAKRMDVECSPGTCVLWDAGYGTKCRDLDFLHAALVLTRVISKPGANRLCLDLGHKAIAAENPHPRVLFLDLPDVKAVMHSEEHLVVETERAATIPVGQALYGIPWHVCPTVALYSEAQIVRNNCAVERWEISARRRRLTV